MERCMQEIGTVHKQGYLTKSPPVTQLNSIRQWKRKFFVILQINPEKGNIFRNAAKGKDENNNNNLYSTVKNNNNNNNNNIKNNNNNKNDGDIGDVSDLHEFYLVYWDGDSDKRKTGSQSLSAIPLLAHYHTHKYTLYEQKYPNTIILVTDNRVYFLTADNEEEMDSWFFHLSRILNMVKSKMMDPGNGTPDDARNDEKSVSEDYYERVDLPSPVPREAWTLPKRLEVHEDVYERMNNTPPETLAPRSPTLAPRSPHHNNTLLSRCSFGSVHGYHSNERPPSAHAQFIASLEESDGKSDTLYANQDIVGVGIENPASKLHIRPPPPSPLPPSPTDMVLKLPPSPTQSETKEMNCSVKSGKVESRNYFDTNSNELYKFLKGPEFTMLSLFDCDVKLPINTVANVTNDGLLMSYGDHEIIIRKSKIMSDDIIEV